MKLVGAAYLVVLGVRAVRGRHRVTAVHDAVPSAEPEAPGLAQVLREGFLVGVANPKSLVFFGEPAHAPDPHDPGRRHGRRRRHLDAVTS